MSARADARARKYVRACNRVLVPSTSARVEGLPRPAAGPKMIVRAALARACACAVSACAVQWLECESAGRCARPVACRVRACDVSAAKVVRGAWRCAPV
eukprot:4076653-Pleurochrysis_carterae.AAC.1